MVGRSRTDGGNFSGKKGAARVSTVTTAGVSVCPSVQKDRKSLGTTLPLSGRRRAKEEHLK